MALHRQTSPARDDACKARDPIDGRTAHARRVFVRVLHESVPEVFKQLQVRVYPKFARYARVAPRPPNLALDTHQPESGKTWADDEMSIAEHERLYGGVSREPTITSRGLRRVKPLLLAWAKDYGCAREAWILEGALRVLSAWKQLPAWRHKLDVSCLCLPIAEDTIVERLSYQDLEGWSPQFEPAASYRARIMAQVDEALTAHIQTVRAKVEREGVHDVQHRIPIESFKLFALVQLGGRAGGDLARERGITKNAVLKNIAVAKRALGWSSLLRHERRGRPPRLTPTDDLVEARKDRAKLTRDLQKAWNDRAGTLSHKFAVERLIRDAYPQLGEGDLSQLLAGDLKASAVAARVIAKISGLSLRDVRSGRPAQPLPRERTRARKLRYVENLVGIEQQQAGKRRGRTARHEPEAEYDRPSGHFLKSRHRRRRR